MSMTVNIPKIEVLGGPERRRRWTTGDKLSIVEETCAPDVTVSLSSRAKAFSLTSSSTGASSRRVPL